MEKLVAAAVTDLDERSFPRTDVSDFLDHFYEPDPQISADLARRRAYWQTSELVLFVRDLFFNCPIILACLPIKVPSGQYEQTVKTERTQQDLTNEMAKELTDLPRYSASAKLVDGEKSRIHKIKTAQFAKGEFPAFCVLSEREAYYKSREAVNREIVQRLEGNETHPKRNQPPPSSI